MHITTRAGRRMIAATALTCSAILLPVAALAAVGPGAHSASATRACGATSTEVWLGLNQDGAAAGQIRYPVEFTNITRHACTLYGFPGLAAINGSARQVGRAAGHTGGRHLVTLAPGQTAHAWLYSLIDPRVIEGCHQVTAAGLQVYPPNQKLPQLIFQFAIPVCTNRAVLRVSSVLAGVGIPG
jgi:Protein of unknown function (DUF4232)